MNTLLVVLIIIIAIIIYIGGRYIYRRSLRIKNQLQMGQIFTNISHELLTPLTVIAASIERMKEQEPRFQSDYTLIGLNIDRMTRLLQQILETSKSQAGELKLKVTQGDVMQYISQTALCLEPLMSKRKIEFTIQCTQKSMMGWKDTDKLDKIIYNLLSNAAKYTQGDHGEVVLHVHTNKKYDHIIIKVSDNGIGIPQDKMKKLFHRFYDGQYRQQQTIGTGLGLALTRELVFLHGGNIECDSTEGVGTTFTVTLPIGKEAFSSAQRDESHEIDFGDAHNAILDMASRMHKTVPQEPAVAPPVDDDAYKLLVVEDNVELLMLMSQLLGGKYHVRTAENGSEALKIIRKEELDIIISDVMMPVMDGVKLTKVIKADPNYQHLPIILLTAKTQEEDRVEALQIGADSFVTKPFKLSDLELRINNIVENRIRVRAEFLRHVGEPETLTEPQKEPTVDDLFLKRAIDCVYTHLSDCEYDRDALAADM